MLTHLLCDTPAGEIGRCHEAAVCNVIAAAQLIRTNVVGANNCVVGLGHKRRAITARPIFPRFRLAQLPWKCICFSSANRGLDDVPHRGPITGRKSPNFNHGIPTLWQQAACGDRQAFNCNPKSYCAFPASNGLTGTQKLRSPTPNIMHIDSGSALPRDRYGNGAHSLVCPSDVDHWHVQAEATRRGTTLQEISNTRPIRQRRCQEARFAARKLSGAAFSLPAFAAQHPEFA